MKKIVGILAAASVMAAAIFAADVNAGTKIGGTVFSYNDGGDEAIELFKEANDSHSYANPNIVFSISDDRAGATIKLTTDGGTLNVAQKEQTIWFKPFDFLKVTLGNYDIALNKETIDWTESFTGLGGEGYLVSVNAGAVSVDLGLNPGANKYWFSNTKSGDDRKTEIAQFFAKVGYSADFGSIGGYVSFNKAKPESWQAASQYYYIDKPMLKDGELTNMDFGVGYKNTFNPITMFVNVIGHVEDKFEWIRPEVFVNGNIEAFGFNVFAAPVIFTNQELKKDFTLEILAKVTYRLDGITPFAYFKIPNAMEKHNDKNVFVSTIKAGVSGNLGLMSYETWVQIDTGVGNDKDKVKISVPFWVSVNF